MPDINLLLAVTWLVGLIAYPVTELLGFEKMEFLPWILRSKTGRIALVLFFPVVIALMFLVLALYIVLSYLGMALFILVVIPREEGLAKSLGVRGWAVLAVLAVISPLTWAGLLVIAWLGDSEEEDFGYGLIGARSK